MKNFFPIFPFRKTERSHWWRPPPRQERVLELARSLNGRAADTSPTVISRSSGEESICIAKWRISWCLVCIKVNLVRSNTKIQNDTFSGGKTEMRPPPPSPNTRFNFTNYSMDHWMCYTFCRQGILLLNWAPLEGAALDKQCYPSNNSGITAAFPLQGYPMATTKAVSNGNNQSSLVYSVHN